MTEVYHIDGAGKEQGVVFCEMQGRENTEEDRASLCFRNAMYPNTGYAVEYGGLTPDIATLTNEEVFQKRLFLLLLSEIFFFLG